MLEAHLPPEKAQRAPKEVVEEHLASISSGDPELMAADYAADAVLSRDRLYVGHSAILSYFRGVPDRLGEGNVVFGQRRKHPDGRISVRWKIAGGQADGLAGTDTYTLSGGMIIHQVVKLDGTDF